MKTWILAGIAILVVLIGGFAAMNKIAPVSWGWWGSYNAASGLAIKGYDPVAYFKLGKPTIGSSEHVFQWNDVSWQFASDENRALFASDPDAFAPQVGGYCAYAVSMGITADVSPDAWHIEDGRLFLFADNDVRTDWVANIGDGSLQTATANWAAR